MLSAAVEVTSRGPAGIAWRRTGSSSVWRTWRNATRRPRRSEWRPLPIKEPAPMVPLKGFTSHFAIQVEKLRCRGQSSPSALPIRSIACGRRTQRQRYHTTAAGGAAPRRRRTHRHHRPGPPPYQHHRPDISWSRRARRAHGLGRYCAPHSAADIPKPNILDLVTAGASRRPWHPV